MPLKLEAVSFGYGDDPILSNVDLEVADGESLAVMGPSGSGKSTLLGLIGALLTPQTGRLLVDEGDLAESPVLHLMSRSTAWIFQSCPMLPRRSVVDNVALGSLGLNEGRRRAELFAHEALEQLGLSEFADRRIETLSGGEVQRVGVARALVRHPRYVLADEPTGQLDAGNTDLVAESLVRLSRSGATLIVATHDAAVASKCERVVHLVDGTLKGLG